MASVAGEELEAGRVVGNERRDRAGGRVLRVWQPS